MNTFKTILSKISRSAFRKKHIFLVLNGFLLATLFYFYMEDNYEKQIFRALAANVRGNGALPAQEDSIILRSLHLTHFLGERRREVFGDVQISTLKSVIHPVTYDLQTNPGACGSYSYVLCRLLQEFNISTRIAQMTVNKQYAGHMVVEAKTSRGWVVVDPTFDVCFQKPDGQLANFSDVQADWNTYSKQVPEGYNNSYRYEGARYTNWNKIPVLMPLLKHVFILTLGKEKTETLSLRTLVLRKYRVLFNITLCIYVLMLLVFFRKYSRRLVGKLPESPTRSNVSVRSETDSR